MSKEQALRRWNILADVIKSKNCKTEFDGSKRSFQSYNIFRVEPIDDDEDNSSDSSWKMVSFKDTSVAVRYLSSKLNLDQLIGFNNTGNVCVWPSEESLAVYCLNNLQLFQGARILEIGGGMTSLAGCMVAMSGVPKSVDLTDGNETSVENLQLIVNRIKKNHSNVGDMLGAFQLRWNENVDQLEESYDVILCADCLFFKESSAHLVQAIYKILSPKGKAYIAAPNREGTFGFFKTLAEELFNVEEFEDYSIEVTKAHESCLSEPGYNSDIHYPKLLVLTKL